MKREYKEIIKAMCDHDMNVSRVARALYKHRGTIEYHCNKIKEEYGLSPLCFRDLVKLEQIVDEEGEEMEEVPTVKEKRYCPACGKEITGQRRKYCSTECMQKYYRESGYWRKGRVKRGV